MGKPSAAYAAETTKAINSLIARSDTDILLPEGLCHFAFRRPCPVECEAYSSGVSEKQKRKSIQLCVLCDSSEAPCNGTSPALRDRQGGEYKFTYPKDSH